MRQGERPRRVLIVLPNWVGDAVMATPALRAVRTALPGAFIGGLCRPGIEEVLAGLDAVDGLIPLRAGGVMGTKRTAQVLRGHSFETALLLTNSFSTALATRMAGIPRRIGFDRDGRGVLLTERLRPLRRRDIAPFDASTTAPSAWAPVPAVDYYLQLACALTGAGGDGAPRLELAVTPADRARGDAVLRSAGVPPEQVARGVAMLNPGGNDAAKRWPIERFAAVGDELVRRHGWTVLVNGGPGELELVREVAARMREGGCVNLPEHGVTLAGLKAIVSQCRLLVTNDTGPRHIAAAFQVPTVPLFGPTDHRWTTIPHVAEAIVVADPTLPACEVANDWPERCAMERIEVERVMEAVARVLPAAERAD